MYDKLSEERKRLQAEGKMPEWFSTGGWQMFKERYLYQAENPYEQYMRIASTLSYHTPNPSEWKWKFFNLMWWGWLSPSTPVLANTGTSRGMPVSCAGNYVSDNLYDIYYSKLETAMLTKMGFGTASYLGDIRPRGSKISDGGTASGLLPIVEGIQNNDMEYVAQGTARRGSWAGYLPIDHGDFWEILQNLEAHPDGNNIGWCVSDEFIQRLLDRDPDAIERYQAAMGVKMMFGKGYFFFPDKANRQRPQCYIDHGLTIKSPQLCNEIMLHSSPEYTYTCVLASMNAAKWDEWKDTDAVFVATVFLDCVVQEFIEKGKNIPGLEKAIAATKKGRALGLGVCGFHTYLLENRIPYESFQAQNWNMQLFKHVREEAEKATAWSAEQWGEPEWCKGYGRANTHVLAVAPTKSTALIMGGISEGIGPVTAYVYTQRTPAGEVDRIDPSFLRYLKENGLYTKERVEEVREAMGSVQGVDWMPDEDKMVFKTAFELDQFVVLRMASSRAKYLDQWQSLNLFFAAGEDEKYVDAVHRKAILDENILGLYYVYSMAGVQASKDREGDECMACQ